MQSFFDRFLTSSFAKRSGCIVAFILIAVLSFTFMGSTGGLSCTAVYIDGEQLGFVGSVADAKEGIFLAQDTASDFIGSDFSFGDRVGVELAITTESEKILASEEISELLLDHIPELSELYVLRMDGGIIGAAASREELDSILSDVLSLYTDSETVSASFINDVDISFERVSLSSVTTDKDKMWQLLTAGDRKGLLVKTVQCTSETQEVAYSVCCIDDDSIYEGESELIVSGKNGERIVTTYTTFVNGNQFCINQVDMCVLSQPVSEVIAVGTLERPVTASTGEYIWPASGSITSYFGYRNVGIGSTNHKGIDIGAAYGSDIVAADGGEVIFAGWYYGYGYLIKIEHDNGVITCYAHCSKMSVDVGDLVAQGQKIGEVGSTGVSSGPHCHFEVRIDDVPADPLDYLSEE